MDIGKVCDDTLPHSCTRMAQYFSRSVLEVSDLFGAVMVAAEMHLNNV